MQTTLVILLLAVAALDGAAADIGCFVQGNCLEYDELLAEGIVQDAQECLQLCQDTKECHDWTLYLEFNECLALKKCKKLNETNVDAISGRDDCEGLECFVQIGEIIF